MKSIYSLLLTAFVAVFVTAQLQIKEVKDGVFTFTYGKNGDWSAYDPKGANSFFVHTWVNATDNSKGITYDDAWTNSNVEMTYDTTENAFVGKIDLNTKIFTNTNNTIPQGTTVQKVGLVFKNKKDGADWQSGDLELVGPTTLKDSKLSVAVAKTEAKGSVVSAGKLYTSKRGDLSVEIYDFSGKLVKAFSVKSNGNAIDISLPNKGFYIMKITEGTQTEILKFSY